MMFHHKKAEHLSVGVFKDHESQPLITVDGINLGTVDYVEDLIAKFRQQQLEMSRDNEDVPIPSVNFDGIQSACVGDLFVAKSNMVSRPEFVVERTEAGLLISYADKYGLSPVLIAR